MKWILAALLAGLMLVAAGPTLLGLSPYRNELPRTRMPGFQNRIEVDSASLGWFSPVVLRGVKFFDNDGAPFLEVGETRDELTLLEHLLHPGRPPRLNTRDTVVTLKLGPHGSNLEEALRPVREYTGKRPPQPELMHSTGATLRIIDTVTGQTTEWRDADLKITRPTDPAAPQTLELTAHPANGPEKATLKAQAKWHQTAQEKLEKLVCEVEGQGLPLADLKPLLRRLAGDRTLPEFDLNGSAQLSLKADLPEGLSKSPVGQASGSIQLSEVSLSLPQLLGADRFQSAASSLAFDAAITASQLELRSLEVHSEGVTVSGKGTVATGDQLGAVIAPVSLSGQVDLAQVARKLPHTFQGPDRPRLDSGEFTFRMEGQPPTTEAPGSRWRLTAGTPLIRATLPSGEAVEWTSPVDVSVAVQQQAQAWRCDELQIATPLLVLHGTPTDQGLKLAGDADLAKLVGQLPGMIDRERTTVSGQVALSGEVGWPQNGQVSLTTEVTLRDLEYRRLVTRFEERAVPLAPATTTEDESSPPRPNDVPDPAASPPEPGLLDGTPSAPGDTSPPQPGLDDDAPAVERKLLPGGRPAPFLRPPQPLPLLGPAERRAQRAANRAAGQADRAARREARREVLAEQRAERAAEASARAAERDSVVYERVPVSEWQTVLRDPQVRLASQATLDVPGRVLKISRAELAATGVRSLSQGEVTGLLKTNEVSLDGKVSTTLAELEQVLTRRTPVPLELEGQQEFAFQVRGPLASPEVQVTGGWERAAAAGLVAGPARFTAQLKDQVFELQPTSFSLSGGEMHVGARANLAAQPLVVEIPAGPVCTNVALTQQICNGWMQYIAPMVSQAARAEGIFSLSLDETRLTPQDLAHAQLSGRLEIPAGRLLPGPLFEQLGQLIAPIEAAARRGGLMADLLSTEKPLAVMQNQVIDFELHDGRIHHTPALVELRKVAISTSGSVGLDQTLDITAVLLFPTNWVERLPFLAGPGGQGLVIPVGGTLKKPRVEPGTAKRILRELGTGALGDLLDGVLPGNLPIPQLPFPRRRLPGQ
jgi:hypothetical protein